MVDKRYVDTRKGRIAYLELGEGPPLLLVHGIPTSSALWRKVMPRLAGDFRCLAPDLMGLGDTEVDPDAADFTMPSQAEMLEQFLDAVGVERAHLVAHDQGGAAAQILVTQRGHRVERLVLTDCVCYDNWPVPAIAQLMAFARVPLLADLSSRLGLMELLEKRTPLSRFRRGVVDPRHLTDETIAEYLRPLRGTRAQRRRFLRFLLAGSARYTMAVAPALRQLTHPTLVLWAERDVYIDPAWGRRLYEDIPGARRFEIIPGAGHFWPEEPAAAEFVARMRGFLTAAEAPRAARADADADAPPADPSVVQVDRLKRRCPTATRQVKGGPR